MKEQQRSAAIKTLEFLGYTYHGGEQWKPPLGKLPSWLDETAPVQLVPDAIIGDDESPEYRTGWNECRETMLHMLTSAPEKN